MSRPAILLALLLAALVVACSGDADDGPATPTSTPPAAAATAATTSSPAATRTATSVPTTTPMTSSPPSASPSGLPSLGSLHGLLCVGQWRNQASGVSGAFSVRVEAGGGGGLLSFEIGGAPFGGAGGIFEAPFRLDGSDIVIDTTSEFLGHVSARIGLGGGGQATLEAPPALGPGSRATMTAYDFADNVLHFTLQVDSGDGSPPHTSTVEAACAQPR